MAQKLWKIQDLPWLHRVMRSHFGGWTGWTMAMSPPQTNNSKNSFFTVQVVHAVRDYCMVRVHKTANSPSHYKTTQAERWKTLWSHNPCEIRPSNTCKNAINKSMKQNAQIMREYRARTDATASCLIFSSDCSGCNIMLPAGACSKVEAGQTPPCS